MQEGGSDNPDCDEIKGERIIMWSPSYPKTDEKERSPYWTHHRAYETTAKGAGGRPVVARIERPWNIRNKNALRDLSKK